MKGNKADAVCNLPQAVLMENRASLGAFRAFLELRFRCRARVDFASSRGFLLLPASASAHLATWNRRAQASTVQSAPRPSVSRSVRRRPGAAAPPGRGRAHPPSGANPTTSPGATRLSSCPDHRGERERGRRPRSARGRSDIGGQPRPEVEPSRACAAAQQAARARPLSSARPLSRQHARGRSASGTCAAAQPLRASRARSPSARPSRGRAPWRAAPSSAGRRASPRR